MMPCIVMARDALRLREGEERSRGTEYFVLDRSAENATRSGLGRCRSQDREKLRETWKVRRCFDKTDLGNMQRKNGIPTRLDRGSWGRKKVKNGARSLKCAFQ